MLCDIVEHTRELDDWFRSTNLYSTAFTLSEMSQAMNVPKDCKAATTRILENMDKIIVERANLRGEKLLYYDDRLIEIIGWPY